MEVYNHDLEITQNNEPFIYLLIEPETKYRFRYASEGGSHGGLAGKEKKKGKKTYPTVQLVNYSGSSNDIFVRVSLCTEKKSDHVMQFKGKKSSDYKSFIDVDLDDDFCAIFKDLTILIPKKDDVYQILLNRKIKSLGKNLSKSVREKFEKEHKEDIKKEAKEIFNSVVLKFDTFEYARPDVQICPSLYSEPICNQKDSSKGELRICRMSKVSGSCKGEEEVILLCEKVQKDNVKIKFYETDANDNRWEAYASFSPSDVHYQVAIPFKTPPYKANVEKRVFVCLERGGEKSEPREFTYIPEDCPSKKRKKCMIDETLKQMPSPMDSSSSSSSAVVSENIIENAEEFFATIRHEIFQCPSIMAESPPSDSNSSSQQDPDCPSLILGHDFQNDCQLEIPLLSDLISNFGDFDGILEDEFVNQKITEDRVNNQSLQVLEENQSLNPTLMPVAQMGMSKIEMDVGKIIGLTAVMNIKDSESKDQILEKVFNESKNKTLENERKKLEQFLPYIDNKDRDGNTLLHLAILYNRNIRKLLQVIKMSNSDIVNAQNNNKETALHIAVEKNSSAVKELLQNSADPSIKNAKGDNCCHIACQHNFVNCLEYLHPRRCHALILQDSNYEGLTPIHVALKNNSISCLDFLFRHCYHLIDFSAVDLKFGQTFLHYAVRYSPSYVSHLLKEGEIEVNCKDYDGNTPLHIACAEGNCEVVEQLMEAGADPGIRNFKHNGSISDEEDSADEYLIGQMPADLTTDSKILNLIKSENLCLSDSNEDKESTRIFEELAKNLSSLLDPDMRWKELALYVLDEEYVFTLAKCSENPTRTILEYMKKTLGRQYIEQLIAVLEMMGFNDAMKVAKERCKPKTVI